MNQQQHELLRYVPTGTFVEKTSLTPAELAGLAPKLEAARHEVLEVDLPLYNSKKKVAKAKDPLDAGFLELPERLLAEYEEKRSQSELGRLMQTAERLSEQVDKVVVLGIGGSYMGAKALIDACAEPYWNELSRGERGGHPRIYYEGNNVDNDASQALLKLLGRGRAPQSLDERWAIIVVSKSGGTLETAVAFRQYLAALSQSLGGNKEQIARHVIPVTGAKDSKLLNLSQALGCPETFPVPDGVGGRFSVFSAVGLLPAAVAGIDVIKLLRGAAAMNQAFRTQPVGANPVLDYVGVGHALEAGHKITIRILSVWAKALECVGLWYDQLLAESLGKKKKGATPLTTVNTRDLHSRQQQHQQGRYDKLITNVVVDHWRTDALPVGASEMDQDGLNKISGRALPELMSAAVEATNRALYDDGHPTANIHLPTIDEHTVGQLLQMLMLATVVEGRLMGINPYGQPGVEQYKKYMKQILSL